jgi:hypothetical protein
MPVSAATLRGVSWGQGGSEGVEVEGSWSETSLEKLQNLSEKQTKEQRNWGMAQLIEHLSSLDLNL